MSLSAKDKQANALLLKPRCKQTNYFRNFICSPKATDADLVQSSRIRYCLGVKS